jgi:hypothetical protein
MSIIDIENLRLHYARTLAHWSERFALVKDRVRQAYGDEFQRAWELYLAGSQAAFATGWMQLFQILFVPRGSAPPSWTRSDPARGAASRRMIRCDALVVGGGPGGSTCARVLHQHGWNVIVADGRDSRVTRFAPAG